MPKGEGGRFEDIVLAWSDASGQHHRLGPSNDLPGVKFALFLRENPAPCGWIKIVFKDADFAYTNRNPRRAKPRSIITGSHEIFIDLLPPEIKDISSNIGSRTDAVVVNISLFNADVVWTRDRHSGPVTISPGQMRAINLLKSFQNAQKFTVTIPPATKIDNMLNRQGWNWDQIFNANRSQPINRFNFVRSKRGVTEVRKPRSNADWDVYQIRGAQAQQSLHNRPPAMKTKDGACGDYQASGRLTDAGSLTINRHEGFPSQQNPASTESNSSIGYVQRDAKRSTGNATPLRLQRPPEF